MAVRGVMFAVGVDLREVLSADLLVDLRRGVAVGLVAGRAGAPGLGGADLVFDVHLEPDVMGLARTDRRLWAMAAAGVGCHPSELVVVTDRVDEVVLGAQATGARVVRWERGGRSTPAAAGGEPDVVISDLAELPAVLGRLDSEDAAAAGAVGVGPHPEPWPGGEHLDPELLAAGDRRNVVDRYRYWREDAIVADLATRRHPFQVAVENWRHDRNIGAVVRNANAFGAAGVHIVGRRRWNRRGAMATDRYLPVHHHGSMEDLAARAAHEGLVVIGIDNIEGSTPLESSPLPERCLLVFGQEGPGLSAEAVHVATEVRAITQYGSTRSLNAGVASGVAMYAWATAHARPVRYEDWQERPAGS